MKILLVAPCNQEDRRPGQFAFPQLTLPVIAAMTPPEHEIEICEEVNGDSINFEEDYDLIGISLMSQTSIRGYEIANEFRKRNKIVVFGGIHATALPMEAITYGDSVLMGEAENGLWENLLSDVKNNKLAPFYKHDKFPDLSENILPRRDLIKTNNGFFDVAPVEASRGCPYNCDFCSVSRFFGTKQRHKNIAGVIRDIESCPQKYLFFVDDNITLDRKFAKELFTQMIPLKKLWVGQASIRLSKDDELMNLAYRSGCRGLLIGFETFAEHEINIFQKTLKTINENITAIQKLRDYGILTMASVIFGFENETTSVFNITQEFLEKAKPAFLQACLMTPYAGTKIFEKLRHEGRILTDDWSRYDTKKIILKPKNMTVENLREGYDNIRKSTYSVSSILQRALPHIFLGSPGMLLYFSVNLGARVRYKKSTPSTIYKNPDNIPVDFNISKYIKPCKKYRHL